MNLARVDTQAEALAVYDRLRDAGYAARILPLRGTTGFDYLVRITSLPSRAEAEALAGQLRGKFGLGEPTVAG